MTRRKLQNWFYYYKWYVVIGLVLLLFFLQWAGNFLGILEKKPDVQAALILHTPVSAEAVSVLEDSLAQYAGDYNHDGRVKVTVHTYLAAEDTASAETIESASASEISLVGDINDCESYLFIMDQPETVQLAWQILADADGGCPAPTDYSVEGKVVPVRNLPLDLSGIEDEEERVYFEDLWLGRRCFYTEKTCRYPEDLSALWDVLVP